MPTSSQAMILKSRVLSKTRIRFKPLPSNFTYDPWAKQNNWKSESESPRGEVVNFDISLNNSPDRSLDGFQGVFAYDEKTSTYRWQICSVLPKMSENPDTEMESGDFVNEEVLFGTDAEDDECSDIPRQPSDLTRHFTTPAASLTDNSKYVINAAPEYHGPTTPLTERNIPPALNIPPHMDDLDETSYRRLEELGFRRRTTYVPSGNFTRFKRGSSPLPSPKRCSSYSGRMSRDIPTLTISNLDVSRVPRSASIPYKVPGFQPKPYVTGDSMRKSPPKVLPPICRPGDSEGTGESASCKSESATRARPVKQKSLLEEVKDTVNWDRRIAPTRMPCGVRDLWTGPGGFVPMPRTACFSLREGWKYSHAEVKQLVEDQLQTEIDTLRYDPISVRSPDPEGGLLDRWHVTFSTRTQCERAVKRGLAVDGDVVVIQAWDDVVRDEYLLGDWDYPCNFRLQSDKHNQALRKFLQVH